jgi:hypothetical protein
MQEKVEKSFAIIEKKIFPDSSNCNTLETMSARSFGFIKPSQKIRDNDMASRLRRHKSFFNADTSSASVIGKCCKINGL